MRLDIVAKAAVEHGYDFHKLMRFIRCFNILHIRTSLAIKIFHKLFLHFSLADEKEGGLRCTACFEMRLDIVAKAAVEHGYDYFGYAVHKVLQYTSHSHQSCD
jgi:predicted adenine nucleotide alpha hydrolase (AANH) superfamily ATPase